MLCFAQISTALVPMQYTYAEGVPAEDNDIADYSKPTKSDCMGLARNSAIVAGGAAATTGAIIAGTVAKKAIKKALIKVLTKIVSKLSAKLAAKVGAESIPEEISRTVSVAIIIAASISTVMTLKSLSEALVCPGSYLENVVHRFDGVEAASDGSIPAQGTPKICKKKTVIGKDHPREICDPRSNTIDYVTADIDKQYQTTYNGKKIPSALAASGVDAHNMSHGVCLLNPWPGMAGIFVSLTVPYAAIPFMAAYGSMLVAPDKVLKTQRQIDHFNTFGKEPGPRFMKALMLMTSYGSYECKNIWPGHKVKIFGVEYKAYEDYREDLGGNALCVDIDSVWGKFPNLPGSATVGCVRVIGSNPICATQKSTAVSELVTVDPKDNPACQELACAGDISSVDILRPSIITKITTMVTNSITSTGFGCESQRGFVPVLRDTFKNAGFAFVMLGIALMALSIAIGAEQNIQSSIFGLILGMSLAVAIHNPNIGLQRAIYDNMLKLRNQLSYMIINSASKGVCDFNKIKIPQHITTINGVAVVVPERGILSTHSLKVRAKATLTSTERKVVTSLAAERSNISDLKAALNAEIIKYQSGSKSSASDKVAQLKKLNAGLASLTSLSSLDAKLESTSITDVLHNPFLYMDCVIGGLYSSIMNGKTLAFTLIMFCYLPLSFLFAGHIVSALCMAGIVIVLISLMAVYVYTFICLLCILMVATATMPIWAVFTVFPGKMKEIGMNGSVYIYLSLLIAFIMDAFVLAMSLSLLVHSSYKGTDGTYPPMEFKAIFLDGLPTQFVPYVSEATCKKDAYMNTIPCVFADASINSKMLPLLKMSFSKAEWKKYAGNYAMIANILLTLMGVMIITSVGKPLIGNISNLDISGGPGVSDMIVSGLKIFAEGLSSVRGGMRSLGGAAKGAAKGAIGKARGKGGGGGHSVG